MRNIYVKNCSFINTDDGIKVKSGTGRGGKITNIFCEDVYMKDIDGEAISFDLSYEDKGAVATKDAKIDDKKIPDFDGFSFKNIYCDGAKTGILLGCISSAHVKNVSLQNVVIKSNEGFKATAAENILLDNVTIISKSGPVFYLNNVNGVSFKNIKEVPATGTVIKVMESTSKKITVENSNIKSNQVELLNGASSNELVIK
jgi:hypothetical protein